MQPETRYVLGKTARGGVWLGSILWRLAAWVVERAHALDERIG